MVQKESQATMANQRWDRRIQEEARFANQIQQDIPEVTRDEALRIAKRVLDALERAL